MAEARLRSDWDIASGMMALVANIFRGKGSAAKAPKDFHPFHSADRERVVEDTKQAFSLMRKLWGNQPDKGGKP